MLRKTDLKANKFARTAKGGCPHVANFQIARAAVPT
jgi:hypothetical protein